MKTIAVNIRESVFNNNTDAMLYATKDENIEPALFIFSVPILTFSWSAHDETDLESFYPTNVFGDKEREQKLLNEMKRAMNTLSEAKAEKYLVKQK
ncbi:hypothetical protein PUS82_00215 [Cytobacillus firmus]|uniref:hypothetical protein n=1 Tax=Cytobacillus firmus TaxID=1399 RepID=UPI00237B6E81|nr:hypothetical protein [Cytobacillus firmus]MDD9309755.1 hypothetical protein [Cytobacillus firmus]